MKVIIGLGSGRCGTTSLARLLSLQPGCKAIHELRPLLPWNRRWALARQHVRYLRELEAPMAASVAFFYLRYVPWLGRQFRHIRFVCLKRDREQTVDSFFRLTEESPPKRNHWMDHDGRRWAHTDWDPCFPKFNVTDKRSALKRYYDDYYRQAAMLADALDNFRIFPTDALDSAAGVGEILAFAGVDRPVVQPRVWLNRWATRPAIAQEG